MLGVHEIQVTLEKYDYRKFYAMTLNVPNLNVQGTLMLSAVIRSDGSVGEVCILRGVDDPLDAYASAALSRWRFRPATRNGDPVALQTVVMIPFRPMRKSGF
jgi:TonB family protein